MGLIENFQRPRSAIKVFATNPGRYVEGRFIEGSDCSFEIIGSIQPLRPRELQQLPEERRNREAIKIYTEAKLSVGEVDLLKSAQKLEFREKVYEIHQIDDWTETDIPHFRVVAFLLDEFREERKAR